MPSEKVALKHQRSNGQNSQVLPDYGFDNRSGRVVESMMSFSSHQLSIVVPTFNERQNVQEFLRRLEATLGVTGWEVIFVDDDSPDGTASIVRDIARTDPRIRCLQRIGRRGLSSACIEGMLATSAPTIAVMDADLQHDEKILPVMLAKIEQGGADIVIANSLWRWREHR